MGRNIDEITPLELLVMRRDYEAREISVPEWRKKYDVSDIGLRTLRKRHGWRSRRQEPEPPPKKPVGRPRIYDPDVHPEQIKGLALLGLTWKRMSEIVMIPEKTLKNWTLTYPEFKDAVSVGRELADVDVVRGLYERATGYEVEEDKIFNVEGELKRVKLIKHYPPDVRAQTTWLSRRQPEVWRESKNVDFTDRTLRTSIPSAEPVTDEENFLNTVNLEMSDD